MTWLARLLAEGPGVMVMDPPAVEGAKCGPTSFDPTLEALCAGLTPEDSRALREERAGLLEFEAGFPRKEAERMAGLHGVPRGP